MRFPSTKGFVKATLESLSQSGAPVLEIFPEALSVRKPSRAAETRAGSVEQDGPERRKCSSLICRWAWPEPTSLNRTGAATRSCWLARSKTAIFSARPNRPPALSWAPFSELCPQKPGYLGWQKPSLRPLSADLSCAPQRRSRSCYRQSREESGTGDSSGAHLSVQMEVHFPPSKPATACTKPTALANWATCTRRASSRTREHHGDERKDEARWGRFHERIANLQVHHDSAHHERCDDAGGGCHQNWHPDPSQKANGTGHF